MHSFMLHYTRQVQTQNKQNELLSFILKMKQIHQYTTGKHATASLLTENVCTLYVQYNYTNKRVCLITVPVVGGGCRRVEGVGGCRRVEGVGGCRRVEEVGGCRRRVGDYRRWVEGYWRGVAPRHEGQSDSQCWRLIWQISGHAEC